MADQKAPTEQQLAEALTNAAPILLASSPVARAARAAAPSPDETWELHGGTAWVYYGDGSQALTRPFILADGFNSGPSERDPLWEHFDNGAYPFLTELRRRGNDVVLLGFDERSASILDNARAATAAILRAIAERQGDSPLTVGGVSMGGLVTRYALAKLEAQHVDHQTSLYFSYDSPHRGAWIPVGLQAFAHYIKKLDSRFSDQMNSPAAQQLLSRHIQEWEDTPARSPLRTEFLAELERVGGWPMRPRKIGVANGVATGQSNGIRPGATAFEGKGLAITGTELYAQSQGDDQLVAQLRVVTLKKPQVRTSGLPDIDGAPGGTLEGFGILADALNALPAYTGMASEALIREHCFVPSVSAVDIKGVETHDDLYTPVAVLDPEESGLDDFKLASRNEAHSLMTEELGSWIIDQLG
ncbi:alpha/beta hydrolase [Streptomyces sp. SID10853]|uniref:esterase/lipase family protein n=1 Tax=Streptomyces sp. SID10853 TaxID=2706028 RepID=UPI0013C1EEFD|nr:alpha/beta hydrolase [Streptomyces sp. SID10853]NDZ79055.1 alpha/beta hydrolase [Streptomyces sp. SID10853]